MMHLFSVIAEQVRTRQDLFTKESSIMAALMSRGCHVAEADRALMLMQSLVDRQGDSVCEHGDFPDPPSTGMRAMTAEERSRFTVAAFGFIVKLAHIGIISEDQREDLLESALTSGSGRIDLARATAYAALFLFLDQEENDDALPPLPKRPRNIAWS